MVCKNRRKGSGLAFNLQWRDTAQENENMSPRAETDILGGEKGDKKNTQPTSLQREVMQMGTHVNQL